jgi:prefoldin subunit 5
MQARERAAKAKIMETTATTDARRDEEAKSLRARLAELEASVREVGARMASLESVKPKANASPPTTT